MRKLCEDKVCVCGQSVWLLCKLCVSKLCEDKLCMDKLCVDKLCEHVCE